MRRGRARTLRRLPPEIPVGWHEESSVADLAFAVLLISSFVLLALLVRGLDKL